MFREQLKANRLLLLLMAAIPFSFVLGRWSIELPLAQKSGNQVVASRAVPLEAVDSAERLDTVSDVSVAESSISVDNAQVGPAIPVGAAFPAAAKGTVMDDSRPLFSGSSIVTESPAVSSSVDSERSETEADPIENFSRQYQASLLTPAEIQDQKSFVKQGPLRANFAKFYCIWA